MSLEMFVNKLQNDEKFKEEFFSNPEQVLSFNGLELNGAPVISGVKNAKITPCGCAAAKKSNEAY